MNSFSSEKVTQYKFPYCPKISEDVFTVIVIWVERAPGGISKISFASVETMVPPLGLITAVTESLSSFFFLQPKDKIRQKIKKKVKILIKKLLLIFCLKTTFYNYILVR